MKCRALLLLPWVVLCHCRPAPEAVPPVAPAVPLLKEGLSPHFLTVSSRLEVGGASFSYLEADASSDLLISMLSQALDAMPAEEKAQLAPNFSPAKLLALFGLDSVHAAGSSSRRLGDRRQHSRAYAYTPAGRAGLLALTGGPAEPMLLRQYAVSGTDLALEFPLRPKDWFAQAWSTVVEMTTATQRAGLEAGLAEPVPGTGLSVRELAEQLDLRVALFVSLKPDQQTPLPGSPVPLPGMDAALVLDRLGPLLPALQQQLSVLPPALFMRREEAGVLTVQMNQPAMPAPLDYQPTLRLEGERLILATRPAHLAALLSREGRLATEAEFAAAWSGLPEQANGGVYVSARFMSTVMDGIHQALRAQPTAKDARTQQALNGIMDKLGKNFAVAQAFAYANEKDGIFAAANTLYAGSSMGALSKITSVAIAASLAVPAFQVIQDKAAQLKAGTRARQLGLALQQYAAEHEGRYPASLQTLVTENHLTETDLLRHETSGLPWLYDGGVTQAAAPTEVILLAAPVPSRSGVGRQTRLVVFRDLRTLEIPEQEFQQRKSPGLR